MGKKIKAIDDYITRSADFAKPILTHIRELVHKACPDVEEKMKWSFPHFDYKNEMMCSMAAFKQHAAMNFWKASLMKDPALVENARSEQSMGHLGRISSLKDLPSDKKLTAYIKEAMQLNEEGKKIPSRKPSENKQLEVPADLMAALKKNKKALGVFEAFSYSNKKEYASWIAGIKSEETRKKNIITAVEWISEGKIKNWKYLKK